MADKVTLHVLFTMDCQPSGTRGAPEGPKSWEQSAVAIDGFCTRLLRGGYPATLFLTPRCAQEHAPLLGEKTASGIELGLYVQPQSIEGRSFGRFLGQYGGDEQREIARAALEQFQEALECRPQSVRTGMFSANDDTYAVLFELGFRQGSLANPGRHIRHHAAQWSAAPRDAHYVDPRDRLRPGDLPFLEIPVTTDANQIRGGLAADLAIENGTLADWHRPLIQGQLARMAAEAVPFRALCFYTRNVFPFGNVKDRLGETLDAILGYLAELGEEYEVIPCTLAGAHARFRELGEESRRGS
jgi:hypothetical protein